MEISLKEQFCMSGFKMPLLRDFLLANNVAVYVNDGFYGQTTRSIQVIDNRFKNEEIRIPEYVLTPLQNVTWYFNK